MPPERVLISNKLAWKRVPLPHPGAEPTFEPGAWVNLKNDAVQEQAVFHRIMICLYQTPLYILRILIIVL